MTTTSQRALPDWRLEVDDREVGAARTDAERAVEDVLAAVPRWRGRRLAYSPVLGGLSNSNWRITVQGDEKRYFMKIPGAGSEAFIDRAAANEASRRAGELGIGPEVVLFDPANGVEIIEYLEGYRASTNGDLKTLDAPLQIVELYQQLHPSGLFRLTKTVFDMVDEHLAQALSLNVRLPADWPALYAEYLAASDAMLASGLDLAPCHNDPMPGNFLIRAQRPMKLVDFEFASNNERAYELAQFTTEMFFDEHQILDLVDAYYGSTKASVLARVHVCGALTDVKWGLWGVLNAKLSSWDFDYHKYGTWKLSRARIKMADPRWGLWLASL